MKYLLPGLVFLFVFQLYTMYFTAYSSFTNYGTGHLGDKEASIIAIQARTSSRSRGGPQYAVVPIVKDGVVSMLVTDPKTGQVSNRHQRGAHPGRRRRRQRNGEQVTGVTGYQSLNLGTLAGNADYKAQWDALQPPIDEEKGIYLRTLSVTKAAQAKPASCTTRPRTRWSTPTDEARLPGRQRRSATSSRAKGEKLNPGWTVGVGFENYTKLFTDPTVRPGSCRSAVDVRFRDPDHAAELLPRADPGAGAQRAPDARPGIYRLLLIVPFGLPFILTALVWKAMLNTDFGLINQILGADVPWLETTSPGSPS